MIASQIGLAGLDTGEQSCLHFQLEGWQQHSRRLVVCLQLFVSKAALSNRQVFVANDDNDR